MTYTASANPTNIKLVSPSSKLNTSPVNIQYIVARMGIP
jgi:hypothetical protein